MPTTAHSDFLENRRTAHRVFLIREKRDRFNPFRHFPWDYQDLATGNLEAGDIAINQGQSEAHLHPQLIIFTGRG
jgi:hypothetical protein